MLDWQLCQICYPLEIKLLLLLLLLSQGSLGAETQCFCQAVGVNMFVHHGNISVQKLPQICTLHNSKNGGNLGLVLNHKKW